MLREITLQTSEHTYCYHEEDRLGRGGFGTVYRGRELASGKPVAIKRPYFHSEEALKRFKTRDCHYLPRLRHPHIVQVLEILPEIANPQGEPGPPALIMELIAGENLETGWARQIKPRCGQEKLSLFLKICQAVAFAHRMGVVHLDLKPGNILFTAEEEPKIIDFGLAASLNPEQTNQTSGSNRSVGTLLYMAPEQQEGKKGIDHLADIYALGLLLFFFFQGRHAHQLLLKGEQTLGEVFAHNLAPPLAALCTRACKVVKSQRFKQVDELIAACQVLLQPSRAHTLWGRPRTVLAGLWGCAGSIIGLALEQIFYTTRYWTNLVWGALLLALLAWTATGYFLYRWPQFWYFLHFGMLFSGMSMAMTVFPLLEGSMAYPSMALVVCLLTMFSSCLAYWSSALR